MPDTLAAFGCSACLINNRFFILGGASGMEPNSTVGSYDPAEDVWSLISTMPEPRVASICTLDNKIYVTGGALTVRPPHPAVKTVEVFTPDK